MGQNERYAPAGPRTLRLLDGGTVLASHAIAAVSLMGFHPALDNRCYDSLA